MTHSDGYFGVDDDIDADADADADVIVRNEVGVVRIFEGDDDVIDAAASAA